SIWYSALLQLAQLASVWFIMKALGIELDHLAYLVIFLISSIVSVLPLTIGGIGSREVTFFYGATFLNLNENISVSISVVFFLITALISLIGVWYHFKKIMLQVDAKVNQTN
ncbi:MAG: lysylphosphatidylglycerol synthase domain-containing protein, partial [Maribacter sp.]